MIVDVHVHMPKQEETVAEAQPRLPGIPPVNPLREKGEEQILPTPPTSAPDCGRHAPRPGVSPEH